MSGESSSKAGGMRMTCSTRPRNRGVAFGGDGDDAAGASSDFLNVGESLFVAQL